MSRRAAPLFHFREKPWRLLRAMREQIDWDTRRHRPIYRYVVTLSNGASISTGFSQMASDRWLLAHWNARLLAPMTRRAVVTQAQIESADRGLY